MGLSYGFRDGSEDAKGWVFATLGGGGRGEEEEERVGRVEEGVGEGMH